ncbi:D-alanyl-D-alanine carboxypeptidase/D-alanyl-D-alanine endopeptidase [Antrihabitans cavernicola]|uniref:D-alanyl-D-alanine carboxypeptidase/D-alanyl-D-alanine-endopeptidase n=1 Tax=Antrihabitans cavernicola TaxID=2495913 RepID=A0A5A7SKL8_9NOCA|nr:D-alanyl-D-alanine carboxypeptidase/D-alanyl-D-alanine-endopeptidase [Spelaeibacter cavernicola]KAA0025025.1 D-alanyl-D-alanine carboxypeptidase/D-alanyl-D-alanine-endopeptidase [Spelaeibacter cavernicola]
MGGLATRRRRKIQALLGGLVVLVLLAAAAFVVVQRPWDADASRGELTTAAEPPPVVAAPLVAPVPASAPVPTPAALAAALAPVVGNPNLGSFAGSVSDAASGTQLWSADPTKPMTPASTTKVLTSAAALLALPSDHRVETRVVRGATPNELVLVGGGDVTLTAQPLGSPNIFPGSAHIADLVDQIKKSGAPVDTIVVDTRAFTGPELAPGWLPEDIGNGFITPMQPLMLDAGRIKPLEDESPRTPTPALDTGRALATALGLDPAKVALGSAPPGAAPVASVQSAPLRDRLRQMMVLSDNILAEAVGREIAIGEGVDPSFTGAASAVMDTLRKAGFDLGGVTLHDVSGMSTDNRVPAGVLDSILNAAAGDKQPKLRRMLDYLPVAGATGTLADRYASGNRSAAGWVRAKTGTLSVASALVGYVVDDSGRILTFALMSNDRPPDASRPALDAIASTLRSCGCQ